MILGDKVDIIKDTKSFIGASEEDCRSKSWHKNGKQIVWKCVTVKYFGTTLKINISLRRLNSGNVCYLWAQNLLSSRLLSKNLRIRIYKTTIFPVVIYGCKTSSLTLREEHRLRVFENRVLRRFGLKRDEMTGGRKNPHNEELHDLYSSPSIITIIKFRIMRWAWHIARKRKRIGYWWENQRERDH
jgi:hypothetical protein